MHPAAMDGGVFSHTRSFSLQMSAIALMETMSLSVIPNFEQNLWRKSSTSTVLYVFTRAILRFWYIISLNDLHPFVRIVFFIWNMSAISLTLRPTLQSTHAKYTHAPMRPNLFPPLDILFLAITVYRLCDSFIIMDGRPALVHFSVISWKTFKRL